MKNKVTIYVITREYRGSIGTTILDSFASYEAADNKATSYAQEYLDRNINGFTFSVQASTFYNE